MARATRNGKANRAVGPDGTHVEMMTSRYMQMCRSADDLVGGDRKTGGDPRAMGK